mmetsp:Transcript_67237/g.143909  ORF Transcript_67237/g.143909 Transcript_67237/m.143909 type:complete len:272 (+) Transcript_67237:385-1200(+)
MASFHLLAQLADVSLLLRCLHEQGLVCSLCSSLGLPPRPLDLLSGALHLLHHAQYFPPRRRSCSLGVLVHFHHLRTHDGDRMKDLLQINRPHASRNGHDSVAELVHRDAAGVIGVHQGYDTCQLVLSKLNASGFEHGLHLGQQPADVVRGRLLEIVQRQACKEHTASLHDEAALVLALHALLLDPELVLLEHAFAYDPCKKSDHAKGAEDNEADEEQHHEGPLPQEAVLCPVFHQIWLGHELEEREHACGYGAKLVIQELMVAFFRCGVAH